MSDGEKYYALRVSEDGTRITAFEAKRGSLVSHVWLIPHLADGFYRYVPGVLIGTGRADTLDPVFWIQRLSRHGE